MLYALSAFIIVCIERVYICRFVSLSHDRICALRTVRNLNVSEFVAEVYNGQVDVIAQIS